MVDDSESGGVSSNAEVEDNSLELDRIFSSKLTDASSFSTSAELRELFRSEQGGREMVVATLPFLMITFGMVFEAATGGVAHVKMAGISSSRHRGTSTAWVMISCKL